MATLDQSTLAPNTLLPNTLVSIRSFVVSIKQEVFMPLTFQYVPMNGVGVLSTNTDVLKTDGLGTCIALLLEYSKDEAVKFALSHVPYDNDALCLHGKDGIQAYLLSVFQLLGDPPKSATKVTVIHNRFGFSSSNKMLGYIQTSLEEIGVEKVKVEIYNTQKRLSVAVLKNESSVHGRHFCYASNKTEFIDVCDLAQAAMLTGQNLVATLDPRKRADKHNFRRHVDLYGQARNSIAYYSQEKNPYSLTLISGNSGSPFFAEAILFSRAKTEHWTKKKAKPPVYSTYLEWENSIRSRILSTVQ
ncbi:hypothetical protein ACONUD_04620 [Microbulbifer harenosus]|uniref:Uncharacterized protein n=1 Tax=Microbulbifer harenosus TaxID=2576840 RepID=A0ABY2UK15_9GAMM|nr:MULTISPECIES: hypothetical protein [Microbulbifer]QIL89281.1 hypothetical protein GNX18_05510 [Microbulbifer sp. SH-1]TLM78582.1 hypothetical protein FDY93_04760 [Microbulbifer harenosus]